MKGVSVIAILASVARVAARTFTVTNNCPFTIWYVLSAADKFTEPIYRSQLGPQYVLHASTRGKVLTTITTQIFTNLSVGTAVPDQPTGYVPIHAHILSWLRSYDFAFAAGNRVPIKVSASTSRTTGLVAASG